MHKYHLPRKNRSRLNKRSKPNKFTPQSFTHTIAKLVGTIGNNGYFTALDRVFDDEAPTTSGLSQFRKMISFEFFQDLFMDEINKWNSSERAMYKGLFVNAIDGDKLMLPCTEEILENGYRGTSVKNNQETYYPMMYYCCATDVITGVPVGFAQSNKNDEIARAIEIIEEHQNPDKTLTIFDRFYFCSRLLEHIIAELTNVKQNNL